MVDIHRLRQPTTDTTDRKFNNHPLRQSTYNDQHHSKRMKNEERPKNAHPDNPETMYSDDQEMKYADTITPEDPKMNNPITRKNNGHPLMKLTQYDEDYTPITCMYFA